MSASPRANHFGVIYADPPWTFATYSRKGKGRSAEAHYDCMTLDDIKATAGGRMGSGRLRAVLVDYRSSTGKGVRRNPCLGIYL